MVHRAPDLQAELTRVSAEDLFLLGVAHARSGDFLRAEQYVSAAQDRGHDEAAVAYWLVRVCVLANRYQSALNHASEHLRDHPRHWPLRLVVASIHEALGDVASAEAELQRIVRADPDQSLPHYRLAMLYRTQGTDTGLSRAHLEQYLRLSPEGRHAAEAKSLLDELAQSTTGPIFVLGSEREGFSQGVAK
ncbi:MAG: tetratricopeptide repeat protein [Polyangiales bacterium]